MQLKITLGSLLFLFTLITACDNFVSEDNSALKDTPNPLTPIVEALPAVASYYADTLSCTDCRGVFTELQFNTDSTFFMTELFVGKEKIPKGTAGVWTQNYDTVSLYAGTQILMKLRIRPKSLQILNSSDNTTDSAIIREVEKGKINPRQPFTISGTYAYSSDVSTFMICNYGKKFPVKKGLDTETADKFFLDKSNPEGKPIYIEAEITAEKVPDKNGNDELQVIIHKVKRKLDGCLN